MADTTTNIRSLKQLPTPSCTVIIDEQGECRMVVGDFRANQCIDKNFVSQKKSKIKFPYLSI